MKRLICSLSLLPLLACTGSNELRSAEWSESDTDVQVPASAMLEDDGEEVEIPLDQVPAAVLAAARAAMPGIVLEEAERETENGVLIYCLEGEVDGKEYEIEVSAAGKVLEIEQDGEEGDEDGDDDHDDDGDDD